MESDERWAFDDRGAAGRMLGAALQHYAGRGDVTVLALPRGGVPVAYEVAVALGAPLDLFLVRKLGVPGHRELAMGAIASGGVRVLNDDVVRWYGITPDDIERVAGEEARELQRREAAYREGHPPAPIDGRTVILVDDGVATGSTMRAAVTAVRQRNAARVVVAVPVGAREACDELSALADEVVCPRTPALFTAVGQWYLNFEQTTDEEVRRLLSVRRSAHR
ncbi:MAG: phosphoribosyltransferase [Acidobacteria bacterium]|nr:phosphoribosyltransferase [Acidobacteriota bacterium]